MTTDVMQGWNNFLVSELGAAAALTGLLFVAVSINLARILQFSHLPTRAAEALLALLSVLVVTTFALIPQQSPRAHGIEIGAIGLLIWAMHTRSLVHSRKFDRQYVGFVSRFSPESAPAATLHRRWRVVNGWLARRRLLDRPRCPALICRRVYSARGSSWSKSNAKRSCTFRLL